MRRHKQDPAFCVQVELSEGCNLQCSFCGIQGIREKAGSPFKLMSLETAEVVAMQLAKHGWNSRIEFAMHGEPTMNPYFAEIVGIFRKHLPRNQLMMTSNGGGFMKDTVNKLTEVFDAGLNVLALDDYRTVRIVPKIRERMAAWEKDNKDKVPWTIKDYPKDGLEWSPHRRWPVKTRMMVIIQDLEEAAAGSHATITNHAGCGLPPNEDGHGKRCAKPFRELSVRWNGAVAGCCNDWRGIFKVGNLLHTDLEDMWQGDRFNAMRVKLYAGERDFGACSGCDYTTYRNGLLPDKLGKKKMPRPTPEINAIVATASKGRQYAPTVKRPWEKGYKAKEKTKKEVDIKLTDS